MQIKQNILYKKRAIEILPNIIKENNFKKILFLSGKTAYQKFGVQITNQLAKAEAEFVLKLVDSVVTLNNINQTVTFTKNCDVIIALGAGSVCDIAKVVAQKINIPYVLIPSLPTCTGYFTDYAFVYEENVYKKYDVNPALKILVDENIICKADKFYVTEGQKFVLSHLETLFSWQYDNLFYDKQPSLQNLKLQLGKFKDNYEYFLSDTDDSKLVLMDILIELSNCFQDIKDYNVYSMAFSLKRDTNLSFSSLCLLACKTLTYIYFQTLSLNQLYVFNLPDFDKLEKKLEILEINKNFVNFDFIKQISNTACFVRANSIKNQAFVLCEGLEKDLKNYKLPPNETQINLETLYQTFNVLPIIYKCSTIFNLIYSIGLMNF